MDFDSDYDALRFEAGLLVLPDLTMGNLKKSLLVLTGIAMLTMGAAGLFLWRSEPRFEGKPLSHWLKVYDTAFQAGSVSSAIKAMGLVERLQDTDPEVRRRATLVLAGMGGWPPKRLRTPTPGELNFLLD